MWDEAKAVLIRKLILESRYNFKPAILPFILWVGKKRARQAQTKLKSENNFSKNSWKGRKQTNNREKIMEFILVFEKIKFVAPRV